MPTQNEICKELSFLFSLISYNKYLIWKLIFQKWIQTIINDPFSFAPSVTYLSGIFIDKR